MATNYSMRKMENQVDSVNPLSHRIVDVDCVYEGGKFTIKSLPNNVPGLFTIRFTAPTDYTAGDVVVVKGRELPVRTPGMAAATSDIFKAGAVIPCDIDMDRELAFFWQGGGNGTGVGVLPNLSYTEQFAGFYDLDGNKVYQKSVKIPQLPNKAQLFTPHGIQNVRHFVDIRTIRFNHSIAASGNYASKGTYYDYFYIDGDNIQFATSHDRTDQQALVTLYYTRTDR